MTSFQNAPFDAPNDLYAKSAPKSVGPTLASSYDELDAEPFQSLGHAPPGAVNLTRHKTLSPT